ncbi:MAG: hypothetical protein ACNS60_04340 [Candidatus Cyclobacteriaceae bacterium M2_1C_046]
MIYRLIFNRASQQKKKNILDARGVIIGTFKRNDRQKYVYLLDNFFVEVIYKEDDAANEIEIANSFSDYRKLEKYMEESIRENS